MKQNTSKNVLRVLSIIIVLAIIALIYFSNKIFQIPTDNPIDDPNAIPQAVVKLENIDYEAEVLVSPDSIYGNILDVPESTKSVFDGWFDSDGKRIIFSSPTPASDTSITAHWSKTQNSTRIPILAFEDFYNNSEFDLNDNFYPLEEFRKLLDYLIENDYYFPTWKELTAFVNKQANLPPKSIILTTNRYDRHITSELYPILAELQIPMTAFIVANSSITDYDSGVVPLSLPGPYLLGRSQGSSLAQTNYDNLPNTFYWSVTKMNQDLEASATAIGAREVFAYPMGLSNPNIVQALKDTNFNLAVTLTAGYVTPKSKALELPRFNISSNQNSSRIISEILEKSIL